MNKILLASVYYQPNYGSILQSYATQKVVESLGYDVETINCKRINKYVKCRKVFFYLKNVFHFSMFSGQLRKCSLKIKKIFNKQFQYKQSTRLKALQNFQESAFYLSDEVSIDELNNLCTKEVKAVIVGSDQLWLPSNIFGDFFTLNHFTSPVRKIAYGTSFGISELPRSIKKSTKDFLCHFSSISVREESGKEIIKQFFLEKEVEVVCDPTILVDTEFWRSSMPSKRIVSDNYIFCYFLGKNPEHRKMVRRYADTKKRNIVTLPNLEEYISADNGYADIELYDISPLDFLNLIYYADEVYTDSFHGTVFSILFHKCFYTLRRFKKADYASTNTRVDYLLDLLGLKSRLIDDIGIHEIHEIIDYQDIDKKIIDFRKHSMDFLIHALE